MRRFFNMLVVMGCVLFAAAAIGQEMPSLPAEGQTTFTDETTGNWITVTTKNGNILSIDVFENREGRIVSYTYVPDAPVPLEGLDMSRFINEVVRPLLANPSQIPSGAQEVLGQKLVAGTPVMMEGLLPPAKAPLPPTDTSTPDENNVN